MRFYQSGLYKIKVVAEALSTRRRERYFECAACNNASASLAKGETATNAGCRPMDDDHDLNQSTIVAINTDSTVSGR